MTAPLALALLLLGCPVSSRALTDPDPRAAAAAIDRLPTWQARGLVDRLDKWAALSAGCRHDRSDAALRVLHAHAARSRNQPVVAALAAHRTRRACDLLAELYAAGRVQHGHSALCSAADDGLPGGQALPPEVSPCARRRWL